jgi:polar amino acid transport system permease protein
MDYKFDFSPVWASWQQLLQGAWMTVQLSAGGIFLGVCLGILCALLRRDGPRPVKWLIDIYVEVIRNTPFLVQLFFVYFGLPALGLHFNPNVATLLTLAINLGAYAAELVRAGLDAVPHAQIEAGQALSLNRWQIFRHIVLMPALRKVYPALVSQFILTMLESSVAASISTTELTSAGETIDSATFRSLETYLTVTVIYVFLAAAFRLAFAMIGNLIFRGQKTARFSLARIF